MIPLSILFSGALCMYAKNSHVLMRMMTTLESVISRKTLKKPLVSRWYSASLSRVMMVVMSVTEPRLKPHCVKPQIFTKLYTQSCQSFAITWNYFGFWNRYELYRAVDSKLVSAKELGAKHGHFGPLYVLGMNVCKKVPYPLIWAGWDSLWEDVKGWRA